jgi:glycosyltransferase involved in cell wall biosynthesis
MTRIAAVLWSGTVGGSETFTVDLCRTMRDLGADPAVVFVTRSQPLGARLDVAGIPHTSLGLARGRDVIRHTRVLARAVQAVGPDGVLLASGGYLAAALRMGGYRGRVVVGGHDATLELGHMTLRNRFVRPLDRATGLWASDIDVAVSDFVLSHMRRQRRRGRLIRIYNGVDLGVYTGSPRFPEDGVVTIAYGGRLIEGKGVDVLLRAFAAGAAREGARLRIGGDGPARPMFQGLAAELGLNGAVEFTGWALDMPSFWRTCDVAAMPSDGCIESFGMAAVEAMACVRPVIVTANGALPELVDDGVTGLVVPRGDAGALADALITLTRDGERRRAAGSAARVRCEQQFDIRDCAASYLGLFQTT